MKKNISFKPKARLLLQLGEQLIRNESVALLELVKNSYDADATYIKVYLRKIDDPEHGSIIIEDDGMGMDIDIIENVWMEPGSDYKEKLYKGNKRSSRFGRLPLGEKGIGRFGIHKLGQKIQLIKKKLNGGEVLLKINWKDFEEANYLEDVAIKIDERSPEVFTGEKTGTRIVIRGLRTKWTRGILRDVYRSLNSLCSPFDTPDSFKVIFECDKKDWLEGLLSWEDIKEYALFRTESEIYANQLVKYKYNFFPWLSMTKLKPRIVERDTIKMVYKDNRPIDLSLYQIGRIKLQLFMFDMDSKVLSLGVQDKKGLKEYLKVNGGIKVFRDGIRIYDFGEPGNDWLQLGTRRVNIPTKRISNNIVIGAVHLIREESSDLREKTNREGFIENDAYDLFRDSIVFTIGKVEKERNIDKEKIRTFYGPSGASEPVISSIKDLQEKIDKKIKDDDLKKELSGYLKRIEDDYKYINEVLLKSAGAGLISLSIVIHEIEKIISELNRVIAKEKPSKRIVALARHLAKLIEGYSAIIRNKGKSYEDITSIIQQALFNIEFRLKAHKIEIVDGFSNHTGKTKIKCARNLITGTIVNIIDNSIWWLNYGEINNKKIFIGISSELTGFISIIVVDNGPGFSLPTEEITKPFVSDKPDGMGLGLHIASEIMNAHGGELIFPEKGDFSIRDGFSNGAVVALCFKEDKI